jgi:hypothetical protein
VIHMLIADEAFDKTFGLVVTFGGIGLIATGIIIYVLVQIHGEHQQNREYSSSRRHTGT